MSGSSRDRNEDDPSVVARASGPDGSALAVEDLPEGVFLIVGRASATQRYSSAEVRGLKLRGASPGSPDGPVTVVIRLFSGAHAGVRLDNRAEARRLIAAYAAAHNARVKHRESEEGED